MGIKCKEKGCNFLGVMVFNSIKGKVELQNTISRIKTKGRAKGMGV